MEKLLIRDNKLTIIDGKIITVTDGVEPSCECCGPGCPWMKVCTDSQGQAIYPTKINNFYIEVSGIADTLSATARYYSIDEAIGAGCNFCPYAISEVETNFEYELNGFSALNRRYDISDQWSIIPEDDPFCDNVCQPCIYRIQTIYVPIIGTFSRRQTTTTTDTRAGAGCETNTTNSEINQVLCSSAAINIGIDNDGNFVGSMSLDSAINTPYNYLSPTRPYEYSYIDIKHYCDPPPPQPGVAYLGDFKYFGFPTGNAFCREEEELGEPILSSPSHQCLENALDINITCNIFNDCDYYVEDSGVNTSGEGHLICEGPYQTSTSFLRSGISPFNIRIVRN